MRLNQNMQSLNVYRNYKKSLTLNASALNKISTGSKINSAKDNPNKLGVSEGLRLQIRSLQMAERNIQDGVSMVQTVDGGLNTMSEALIRMKELTIQASGSTSEDDRKVIQVEIDKLKEQIDYTAENSEFNGVKLLNSERVTNNNYPKYLKHTVGANTKEDIDIPVYNLTTDMLTDREGNSLKSLNVVNSENIDKNLQVLDSAMATVNSARSRYGAIQNRMETSATNLSATSLNLEKAESRIRDTDIALEMSEYARTSILQETSIALMQQTNNFPKDILRVLENMK
ncbi:MAG: flagellin [Clostridium sp.]|uniref:flagellin N-terminal helical domain-containing protein n=1 Tax=Clostridium sp. TaxID=1506 RepID=UPI00290E5BC7|nr:flagellin [Clostridium sp.]MDU5111505.1 flagellin [Clostridium sp.]